MINSSLYFKNGVKCEIWPGTHIDKAIDDALKFVKKYNCFLEFHFNDKWIIVTENLTREDIYRQFDSKEKP